MRALVAAILALASLAPPGPLRAQEAAPAAPECGGAEHLARADASLPRVAAAVKADQIKIVVVGSGSSLLAPQAGPGAAYPARLEKALSEALPRIGVKVAVYAQPRRSAASMAEDFERILGREKPALVIWQTGTVDALRGVDPEEFRATLEEGVERLHEAGADVILMNMQYSPRTESMIATDPYLENMRVVAMQQEVPLFDRFGIMKQWNELGIFDLMTNTREYRQAMRVHDCLGRLLADMIVDILRASEAIPAGRDPH